MSTTKKLEELSTEELGLLYPIILTEYDPMWPEIYEAEKKVLLNAFGSEIVLNVYHIGSTAIPELISKPVIDIILEIKDSADTGKLKESFTGLGYHFNSRKDKPAPHMTFVKGYNATGYQGQAYHVHVRYKGEHEEIFFRDYLRSHPEAVQEYSEVKQKLADKYKNNRELYTEGKNGFIQRIQGLKN